MCDCAPFCFCASDDVNKKTKWLPKQFGMFENGEVKTCIGDLGGKNYNGCLLLRRHLGNVAGRSFAIFTCPIVGRGPFFRRNSLCPTSYSDMTSCYNSRSAGGHNGHRASRKPSCTKTKNDQNYNELLL